MTQVTIKNAARLKGNLTLSGDKSITHRAIIIGSISEGITSVKNYSTSDDCAVTVNAFSEMGIKVGKSAEKLLIYGKGLKGLSSPGHELYMANSGTSMRLILGILAGQDFESTLTGDKSLSKRPMRRVTEPLSLMGAKITGCDNANLAPISIKGGKLRGIDYKTKIPSAQIKSAILLAALYAEGITRVTEPIKSRDHTERMLKFFGAKLKEEKLTVSLEGPANLKAKNIVVPGDISSASFFIVAASLVKNSEIVLKSVSLNPTRTGLLDVIKKMGGDIKIIKESVNEFEPKGDIVVKYAKLKGVTIKKDEIPRLIDELPVFMVASSLAKGTTIIKSAGELRVKETDRIHSMMTNLNSVGGSVIIENNDIIIKGKNKLKGGRAMSFGDHRTAMSMAIAGLISENEIIIDDGCCISKSFPDFFEKLYSIVQIK